MDKIILDKLTILLTEHLGNAIKYYKILQKEDDTFVIPITLYTKNLSKPEIEQYSIIILHKDDVLKDLLGIGKLKNYKIK
jgi:hypothetical protein